MIKEYDGKLPVIADSAYVGENAVIMGDVIIGERVYVCDNSSIRGDEDRITIGNRSNIQDGVVVHGKVDIGENVTVGHGAIVHACTVESNNLIGMGSIILDNAVIYEECIVGAGALVTGGKKFGPRKLILGNPAREIRDLTEEEIKGIYKSCQDYQDFLDRMV